MRFLRKSIIGYRIMFVKPFLSVELSEVARQYLVQIRPFVSQLGYRWDLVKCAVGILNESFVKFRIQALAQAQKRDHPVVDRYQVAQQINGPVFAFCNGFQQTLV
ncbi:hypothetical protein D3C87_1580820 [compost metagenome]